MFRPGTQNGKADALPRRSVDLPEEGDGRSRPTQVLIPVEKFTLNSAKKLTFVCASMHMAPNMRSLIYFCRPRWTLWIKMRFPRSISIPNTLKSRILLWPLPPVSAAGASNGNAKVECRDMWHGGKCPYIAPSRDSNAQPHYSDGLIERTSCSTSIPYVHWS